MDFILGEQYHEVNLMENPCVFPRCGHFLTIESMDAQMDIKKHYTLEDERPVGIAQSSQPFSIDDIQTCAICRGSLRDVSRYGRLVRRALLDETTKKFILYINQQHVPMAQELIQRLSELQGSQAEQGQLARMVFQANVKIRIEGPPACQIREMYRLVNKYDPRWKDLLRLRDRISEYKSRVQVEEQPFNRVHAMVKSARQHNETVGQFDFDANVLQTKGYIQAVSLLLRLDAALLADFLSLCKQGGGQAEISYDLTEFKKEINALIEHSETSRRTFQQTEGNIFLAQFCALERQAQSDPSKAEALLHEGSTAITEAQSLCDLHPGQTRGLLEEVQGTKAMLRGSEFYAPVRNAERIEVLAAMAREFRGTGHWYYCENGHPFTIGECGGAVQMSRCPECGAAVGGRGHQTADGVTRAVDLEDSMRDMQL